MSYRILHIDDDSMMQKIYKSRLEADGCSMRGVSTGQEGIEIAVNEKYDFILLDHILPDMTSLDVLRALKEKGVLKYSRVIVLTSSGQENDAERAKEAGASAFFSKDKVSPRDMLVELTRIGMVPIVVPIIAQSESVLTPLLSEEEESIINSSTVSTGVSADV